MHFLLTKAALSRAWMLALIAPFSHGVGETETQAVAGHKLDASAFGPSVVEGMREVEQREGEKSHPVLDPKARNGAQGDWRVPKQRRILWPRSGEKYAINYWGDTRLGIGFGRRVDLRGAWLAGHGTLGAWTSGVRAIGYRAGRVVARTDWFESIGAEPSWFAMNLDSVDRVEFVARAVAHGSGWFGLDDLTYEVPTEGDERARVVVDFEDVPFGSRLRGSGYAGLDWEIGSGDFAQALPHAPLAPLASGGAGPVGSPPPAQPVGGGGTTPTVADDFDGPLFGDPGSLGVPDTNGAAGPQHYIAAPNGNLSIYERATGQRLTNVSQTSFWGTSGVTLGDPRVAYDSHEDRFVMIASDWTARVYFAYSLTSDPTGAWFKTSIATGLSNEWPDYPTLGLDERGFYMGVLQVENPFTMSIFTIDKGPLLQGTPSMGTVTAFRGLPYEGAIQPCVTFGDSGGAYFVSRASNSSLRLRQVTGPLTAPSLVELGLVSVPTFSEPPDAPQAGTNVRLSVSGSRPMNATFRNGSVWTTHCIDVGGRASVRWYEIDPNAVATVQVGTAADAVMSYFMPSIAVNQRSDVLVAFSGSSPNHFAGAYLTGRRACDLPNETGVPVLVKDGEAPYTYFSGGGTSRWGDYSVSGVDPLDDLGLWTVQEYAKPNDVWGQRVALAIFDDDVVTYCTAKSGLLCGLPAIASTGASSASSPSGFVIEAAPARGGKSGTLLYSDAGRAAFPFQGGTLCIDPSPLRRTVPIGSNGTPNACDGVFAIDMNAFAAGALGGNPAGFLITPGTRVNTQFWGRDSVATGSFLSNGLEYTVCP